MNLNLWKNAVSHRSDILMFFKANFISYDLVYEEICYGIKDNINNEKDEDFFLELFEVLINTGPSMSTLIF